MQMLVNNRYQIIRVLGSGGFGNTFLAEDIQMPSQRLCVIKQLKPIEENPQIYQLVQERFGREAAILEELGDASSQIPRLYAYFSEDERFYLVQEYIEGKTLAQKLKQQGVLSESNVKKILIDILLILEYVHIKGIVHRDIKPDNIIIRSNDSSPVLIDFGAVKETMRTIVSSSENYNRSIVIGTPGFMPDEQAAGRPMFASDIYSLGLTAIYLLTGKIPQELSADPATGKLKWRQYASNLTSSFTNIIDKAIHPSVNKRYSTAKDMLEVLQLGTSYSISATEISPVITLQNKPEKKSKTLTEVSVQTSQPNYSRTQLISVNKGLNDWQKTVIMGSVIGICVFGGLWFFGFNKPTSEFESEPVTQISSTNSGSAELGQLKQSSSLEQENKVQPQKDDFKYKQTNQPRSLGWIRIGAVDNTTGNASIGELLIKTSQPITVTPSVVPSIGDEVTIINEVNFRSDRPRKPNYKLANQTGVAVLGQKLIILQLDIFTDPTSSSPYTILWAKVGASK